MSIERRRRDPNAAKPLGPIPQGFEAIDGELAIGGRKASDLVAEAGDTPLLPAFPITRVYLRRILPIRPPSSWSTLSSDASCWDARE